VKAVIYASARIVHTVAVIISIVITHSASFVFVLFFFVVITIITIIIIIINIIIIVSCHRPFLPGTSLELAVILTAQASSFTLQYFPYYV
jgi:hypothetical protein